MSGGRLREQFACPRTFDDNELLRDFADYDCAFGLDGPVA